MQPEFPREYVRCALCGSDDSRVLFTIDTGERALSSVWLHDELYQVPGSETIVACQHCDLVYVNPRLAPQEGLLPYSSAQELAYFEATRQRRQRAYQRLLTQLPAWATGDTRTLLDIGCGDGVLLEMARQAGIDSQGSELSEPLRRLVRERLGDKAIVAHDLADLHPAHYDVVTLLNVIEHLPDPASMLQTAAHLLKPGGVLLVHTPNLAGLPARLRGARWHQIEPLAHLYYFTPRTLAKLLQQAGLQPVGRFNLVDSHGSKGLIQRILGGLGLYLDNGLGMVARRPPQP